MTKEQLEGIVLLVLITSLIIFLLVLLTYAFHAWYIYFRIKNSKKLLVKHIMKYHTIQRITFDKVINLTDLDFEDWTVDISEMKAKVIRNRGQQAEVIQNDEQIAKVITREKQIADKIIN